MIRNNYIHSELTGKLIKAFYNVYNTLLFGFLEKVYENSMIVELRSMGLKCVAQFPIDVYYRGGKVGKSNHKPSVES